MAILKPCILVLAAALALSLMASAAGAATPRVAAIKGDIVFTAASGATQRLTRSGVDEDPVLAPDGRTVAFIRREPRTTQPLDRPPTSLWVADTVTGATRRLLGPQPSDDPERDLGSFGQPLFSLDGGLIYVAARAWVTSDAVHQVRLDTGATRFVIAGSPMSVIRTGPYRGHLLVNRHLYRKGPAGGSYNPTYVVRPDGKPLFAVPRSEIDDEDGRAWLARKGWRAW